MGSVLLKPILQLGKTEAGRDFACWIVGIPTALPTPLGTPPRVSRSDPTTDPLGSPGGNSPASFSPCQVQLPQGRPTGLGLGAGQSQPRPLRGLLRVCGPGAAEPLPCPRCLPEVGDVSLPGHRFALGCPFIRCAPALVWSLLGGSWDPLGSLGTPSSAPPDVPPPSPAPLPPSLPRWQLFGRGEKNPV